MALWAIAVLMRVDGVIAQAQIDAPNRLDAISKQVDGKLDPLVKQYAEVGASLAGAARQLDGLIADVRKEIPTVKESLTVESSFVNKKLDAVQADVAQLSSVALQLDPLLTETTHAIRDLHPQLLGTVAAFKVTVGETAQTMKTVRDTVKAEAGPTAQAVRESAQGTAKSTDAAAKLIEHSDEFVVLTKDLIYGRKSFWARVRAFLWGVAQLGVRTSAAW